MLRRNPLRSFLTVLGIVIGVTTIIVIGAVINGLNSNVMGNIQSLGSSTVIVSKFSWATLGRLSPKVLQRKDLNPEWVKGLRELPHVVAAAPVEQIENYAVGAGASEVRRGDLRAKNVILTGEGPAVAQISDFNLSAGGFSIKRTKPTAPLSPCSATSPPTLFFPMGKTRSVRKCCSRARYSPSSAF